MRTLLVPGAFVQTWSSDPEAVHPGGRQPLEGRHVQVIPAAEAGLLPGLEVAVGRISGFSLSAFTRNNLEIV